MRKTMGFAAVTVLLFAVDVMSQMPAGTGATSPAIVDKDKKPSLEELLAKALQNSPEVQVAEARLKEAEAQLRQTRMQVAQRLVDLHMGMESKTLKLTAAEAERKQTAEMIKKGVIPTTEINQKETAIQEIKAQIAQLETSVNALTGRLPFGQSAWLMTRDVPGLPLPAGAVGGDPTPNFVRPPEAMVQKMRAVLNQQVKAEKGFQGVPLNEVLQFVRTQSPTVPMLFNVANYSDVAVTIDFKGDVSLGSFFLVLTDTVPDLRIIVRDYGFLFTVSGSEPADGMPLTAFLREPGAGK